MTLSEMRHILTTGGIQLTRSLGQNFLHDGNQIRRIVTAGDVQPTDKVLEIGPGLGPLTELLVDSAKQVLAIEKDHRLIPILQTRFADKLNLTILADDALELLKREPRDWSEWKLVANLPYSVASPILVELAANPNRPIRMAATLQLEVVQRIAAKAGSSDYGLLALLLQVRYQVEGWFKIPPACFFPEPEIDSGCITLIRRETPLIEESMARDYTKVVKRAFSQRRKMMYKLLRGDWPETALEESFAKTGIPRTERAEKVALEQFVALTQALVAATHTTKAS
ncbi:MAG TPA: 16S rRNA (adenine(1518)-N(6)/adenine(1519)-N(6))-dimethyltransferase RsmA [Roseimicrobium sp.]|nr:16S rRNA (adenine(1518)-N(6)/adenine(1519)-N(6))-dimethyltransferase RsmA [Roseimicrobium sp.]